MYDIVVVGGGPAGMTAALYAARAGKNVMLLECNAFGGQMATAPLVENFPAADKMPGAELANRMFGQITGHDVDFDMGTGVIDKTDDGFVVRTEYMDYECHAVVLATGVTHKKLNVEGEDRLIGNGVCYCAVCDGAFYKDKNVCVVGDGNSAVQYALYLSEICAQVTLVTMFDRLFCDKELEQRLFLHEGINRVQGVLVTEIVGDEHVKGLVCRGDDGAVSYIDCDAVFVAIGQEPHNENFAGMVQLDDRGYIVAGEDCRTSHEGIFAAGDCRTKSVRQCATAVGDGAVAGYMAASYVTDLKNRR